MTIQQTSGVDLINADEEARIRELWSENVYPDKWDGTEIAGDVPIASIQSLGATLAIQPLLSLPVA